ncbi:unnamed protein product [Cladocopium goreaui]|uniref:Probable N6-adenosine-methyltransferase MT-A70-like n=1 Tax=Cladocopium goreaui TaxID=2562237 RepID=A0A9P1GJJ4_9DINO|nr:unnamed protein product [Cladocopium goreaui]
MSWPGAALDAASLPELLGASCLSRECRRAQCGAEEGTSAPGSPGAVLAIHGLRCRCFEPLSLGETEWMGARSPFRTQPEQTLKGTKPRKFQGQDTVKKADTAAALQAIFQGLKDTNASDALVLDGEGEDLSLLEADSLRIASFHGMTGASQDAKRARREHRPPTTSAVQDFPLATATPVHRMAQGNGNEVSVEELLQAPTARQRQLIDQGDELRQLLAEPTARQSFTAQKFMNKSQSMAQFCAHGSRDDCRAASGFMSACAKIHFRKVIKPWTDESSLSEDWA